MDGSYQNLESTGVGYVAYRGGRKIITGNFCLCNFAAVVDAQVIAIVEGIESIITSYQLKIELRLYDFRRQVSSRDLQDQTVAHQCFKILLTSTS